MVPLEASRIKLEPLKPSGSTFSRGRQEASGWSHMGGTWAGHGGTWRDTPNSASTAKPCPGHHPGHDPDTPDTTPDIPDATPDIPPKP